MAIVTNGSAEWRTERAGGRSSATARLAAVPSAKRHLWREVSTIATVSRTASLDLSGAPVPYRWPVYPSGPVMPPMGKVADRLAGMEQPVRRLWCGLLSLEVHVRVPVTPQPVDTLLRT